MIWLIAYDIIYILLTIFYLPVFLLRGKYHSGMLMRLGLFEPELISRLQGQKVIWLHAVSVGEVGAIKFLLKSLKQQYPDYRLVLSTVTKTGNQVARSLLEPGDLTVYSPLDIGWIVNKVIKLIKPRIFIVAETEIWPNLIVHLAAADIPIVLVNGRISAQSFRGYRLVRPWLKKILAKFTLFCMQSEEDVQKIRALGAEAPKIELTGNMKFDLELDNRPYQKTNLALAANELLFIAGSTHPGEEKIILQCFRQLVKEFTNLRLLIAPRHIQRARQLETLISQFGFSAQRVSQLNLARRPQVYLERPVLILDSMGELNSLYPLAEIVFVGGSLIAHGGQNPIEPAIWGKPVLFGPHMDNFSKVTELLLEQQAAIMVQDAQQLTANCQKLLNQPGLARELGARAAGIIAQNKGASSKNMQLINQILHEKMKNYREHKAQIVQSPNKTQITKHKT